MELGVTAEIPSMDLLEKIIIDDKCFYEFSNNKESIIYGFKVEELQKHLKDYISNNMASSNVSEKFSERAKYFNDKFNMNIPVFRDIQDGLNEEFYNYIVNEVDSLNNPLAKARAVYLRLAKVICYDEHFPAYNQNLNNPLVQDMYYKNTSSVTLENNKVTCSLWAMVYAEILNKLGIPAKVVGGKHKLVEFTIEGKIYSADATNSFLDNANLYLNDLTRVKLNSPTLGFEGQNDFDDKQIGYNPQSLVEQYYEFSNNHAALSSMRLTTGSPELDMIVSKLDYLSTMAYNLPQIEAVGYLKQMTREQNSIFTEEEIKLIEPTQIRLRDANGLNYTSLVIAIRNGDEYIYRLLKVPEGLIAIEKGYLINEMAAGNLINDGNISGVNLLNR